MSGINARAHALRAVIVRLCYKDFLTSNFADRKGHSEHKSYFIETYLADSGDRDHSESPGRSTMRDRIDRSRKWKSQRSNRPPFSTYYLLPRVKVTIPTLLQGDQTATSDVEKAELLNAFFSTCFNRSHPPLNELPFDPSATSDNDPSLDEIYCTVPEVEQLLCGLEVSKACGPDKISAQMLKHTALSIAPSVTKLFNLSIRVGRIPDDWKESMIAPIPKSATKSSDPGNFRPISLTCILSKLLEKHIHGLMYEHLANQQELSDSQWGFRSGRSTVTALLSVTQEWLSTLEHGHELCAVFFDLIYRKAFDSVPHRPLLEKLESLGFDAHISALGYRLSNQPLTEGCGQWPILTVSPCNIWCASRFCPWTLTFSDLH